MFGKRARFVTMVGAALGIPYAWFNADVSRSINSTWANLSRSASTFGGGSSSTQAEEYWPVSTVAELPATVQPQRSTATVHSLADVLRFDVDPRWVIAQWGRVSTVHAERDLEGMRVPLVTGTADSDIAGSLTYYFDRYKRLRRITLQGQTGDDRALIGLLEQKFAMLPEPALGAGVYIRRWNAKPMNALRIALAPVVRAAAPTRRFVVELELNDVTAGYGLSPEFKYLLSHDQAI